MKLWLLKAKVEELPEEDNPWEPWYDKCFGFVIRAYTEEEARFMADELAGDENRGEFLNRTIANTSEPWKDSKYSECTELTEDGESGLILQDFRRA